MKVMTTTLPLNWERWMVRSLWLRSAKSGTVSPSLWDVVLDGGFVVGAGLSDDDDVVELGSWKPAASVGGEDGR